jgi:phosphatidylinositol glycan class S
LEKDNLIRTRTLENVVNTISTLRSLAQLVNEIPNMVVEDHINIKVRQSLDALELVSQALRKERYVEALQKSIEAIELAEKAFFDPTMVSMLYFPDEHKYAIYMPLFVPISVPLVMALLKEVKKLKQQQKKKTKEE